MNLTKWAAKFTAVGFTIVVLVFAYQVAYPRVYPFYYGRYTDYEITNWVEASGYANLALSIAFDFEEKDYSKLLGMSVEGETIYSLEGTKELVFVFGETSRRNVSSWGCYAYTSVGRI